MRLPRSTRSRWFDLPVSRRRPAPARLGFALLGSLLVGLTISAVAAPKPAPVSFLRDVAPVLQKRCAGCHGERLNLGGYRLHSFQNLMRAGTSGATPVVAGKPAESNLVKLLTVRDPEKRMPKGDEPLSAAQQSLIARWISEGAKFDGPDTSQPYRALAGPRLHPAAPVAYPSPTPVLSLTFAPGGKEIVSSGYHELLVWDASTGALRKRIGGLPQRIQAIRFSPDGGALLIGGGTPGDYGEAALVPASGGKPKVLDTWSDLVLAAAFNREGRLAAVGAADGSVRLYDVVSGKRLWAVRMHSDWVTGVSFSADGKYVASSSKDMTVKVYETGSGALFTTYNGHNRQLGKYRGQNPVYTVAFTADSAAAVSAGGGTWLQIWEPEKARAEAGDAGDMEERFMKPSHTRYVPHGFQREVLALLIRDGKLFAGGADGVLKEFDFATGKELRAYRDSDISGGDPGQADWLFGLDYDAAGKRIVTGSYRGEIRLWNTETGKLFKAFANQPRAKVQ